MNWILAHRAPRWTRHIAGSSKNGTRIARDQVARKRCAKLSEWWSPSTMLTTCWRKYPRPPSSRRTRYLRTILNAEVCHGPPPPHQPNHQLLRQRTGCQSRRPRLNQSSLQWWVANPVRAVRLHHLLHHPRRLGPPARRRLPTRRSPQHRCHRRSSHPLNSLHLQQRRFHHPKNSHLRLRLRVHLLSALRLLHPHQIPLRLRPSLHPLRRHLLHLSHLPIPAEPSCQDCMIRFFPLGLRYADSVPLFS